MIGLMRDARLRVSEAAALTWGDLERVPGGSGRVRVGDTGYRVVSADTMKLLSSVRRGTGENEPLLGMRPNQIAIRIGAAATQAGLGEDHDLVCDLCHYDAHIQARLPVTEKLKESSMLRDGDELPPNRDPFLKDFLEEERCRVGGGAEDRKGELRLFIDVRESELVDVKGLWGRFEQHLQSLPDEQRPENEPLKAIAFVDWMNNQESELDGWKKELANLENLSVDGQLVFSYAKDRLLRLLEAEGREAGLLPRAAPREAPLRTMLEEPSPSRLTKDLSTPEREFIRPILESLIELGGSAKGSQVVDIVFQKMKGKLNERDLESPPSEPSTPRWRKRAYWCRFNLVQKHKFLNPNSPRGVWEITDSGRNYLKSLK